MTTRLLPGVQRLKAFTGWGKTPETARANAADELLKWLEAETAS